MPDDETVTIEKWLYEPDTLGWDVSVVYFSCGHWCSVWEPDTVEDLKVCPTCKRRIERGEKNVTVIR